jgi:hypothetical protein
MNKSGKTTGHLHPVPRPSVAGRISCGMHIIRICHKLTLHLLRLCSSIGNIHSQGHHRSLQLHKRIIFTLSPVFTRHKCNMDNQLCSMDTGLKF